MWLTVFNYVQMHLRQFYSNIQCTNEKKKKEIHQESILRLALATVKFNRCATRNYIPYNGKADICIYTYLRKKLGEPRLPPNIENIIH